MRTIVSVGLLLAAIFFAVFNFGATDILSAARGLSVAALLLIFAALILNGLAAAVRLKIISQDIGRPIGYGQAIAAVSAGSIAGAAFFQIAGQLMARGAIMTRSGVDFSTVVVMTAYERAVAAALSLLLALAGGYFIFGRIYFDQSAGGGDLIRIVLGLLLASISSALYAYARTAIKIAPTVNSTFVLRFIRAIGLSLVVQAPMMAAYIVAAHTLSPNTDLADLVAASAIVMFAASIPISFAGWGVREMSAVVALGTIGVTSSKALVAAVVVGICSLVAMSVLALLTMRFWSAKAEEAPSGPKINYASALFWVVPIAAATLVLFQLYVPISSGTMLNVNLADPVAILGGSLFLLSAIQQRTVPRWRFDHLNSYLAGTTLILTIALLIGIGHFGPTEWAWVNRYLGWFVLLAYGATGALIVRQAGSDGLTVLLRTYVAATAAVIVFDILLVSFGNPLGKSDTALFSSIGIAGFAQNRNFLAFQTLMAIAALSAAEQRPRMRILLLSVFMAGLLFAASRSGWISLVAILAVALYAGSFRLREVSISAGFAAAAWVVLSAASYLTSDNAPSMAISQLPTDHIIPTDHNTQERMFSINGGLQLFLEHPLFGAGLGAFRNLGHLATSKLPLLIHSSYVWLLAETGIVGFCVFVGFALHLLVAEFRRQENDAAWHLIILCLTGFAVMSLPADMIYQRTFWLLIGAGLALTAAKSSTPSRH